MLIVIGRVACAEGKRDELIGLMREMQDASRAEPGCLRYGFYAAVDDPDEFIAVEEWESVAALRDHFSTDSLARFAAGLGEAVARRPELAIHSIGATNQFPDLEGLEQ